MKQLIEDLISAIEYHVEQTRPIHSTTIALQAARDALKSLPPQRTWVELTHSEFAEILCDNRWQGRPELMLLQAQAKLKEKNCA